jgi:hypothetical protein
MRWPRCAVGRPCRQQALPPRHVTAHKKISRNRPLLVEVFQDRVKVLLADLSAIMQTLAGSYEDASVAIHVAKI